MMERRRTLTVPTVDKDNLVSWKEFAGRTRRHCESQLKNGALLLDQNLAAQVRQDITKWKPVVMLTDVLKSDKNKAYLEKMKRNHASENRGQVLSSLRERLRRAEEPVICREMRPSQQAAKTDQNRSVTPKSNQKTTPVSCQRLRASRRLQSNKMDTEEKQEKQAKEVVISKDSEKDYRFAEVVDCGLSVSWEPAEETGGCDEFSPAGIKENWTDPEKEVQCNLKRKSVDEVSQCNGTLSPKRHRESVLRLTGEDGRDKGAVRTELCLEENGDDGDLDSLDRSIVQFTVGADEPAEVLLPIIGMNVAGELNGALRESLSASQDDTTQAGPSEPIVLSSDDEEGSNVTEPCTQTVHTPGTAVEPAIQGEPPQEAGAVEHEPSDMHGMQVLHVVLEDPHPASLPGISSVDNYCMAVGFSTLHCGGCEGKSNGDLMIADGKILIPLKDTNEQRKMMLTLERKELRRYSVWEREDLEVQELYFNDDNTPIPPAMLLFCVSPAAAAAVQQDLLGLCARHDGATNAGAGSPFVLLTLKEPLQGMEGALLRSLLDIDCLNSLANEESITHSDSNTHVCFRDFHSPVLTLEESIELVKASGLDSHLLRLLGVESPKLELEIEQDVLNPEMDPVSLLQLELDLPKQPILELETATEQEAEPALKPEEGQKEQVLQQPEPPTEQKRSDEDAPVYTLCHRRTKGSYSVSMCKSDSSWIKYKHRGLAHRLIQFPPPPLKGGITVTMEDLQCLDSGMFLNDVIIDFYLKYLLHKASDAVAQRSHIFSSFFYKQLTRRDNASEGITKDSCQRQRRHQRVKTWTRHVDIFKKDFLFVPVNQEAHWYLVVICFPGLDEPKVEPRASPHAQTGGTDEAQELAQGSKSPEDNTESPPTPPTSNHSEGVGAQTENGHGETTKDSKPAPVSCTERTCLKKTVCKRPCILVMDSLKRSPHERVFKLLRDYLESEWEVRRGSSREFSPEQMQSSHCQVPLQDNSSDCGLYLLQYVESFLKDPVVHFDLPLQLERWFPRQLVRRKRDNIRDLVLNLYRCQKLDSDR
ncbi:uncharacterized protein V6R79_000719 [Siganus canaliculatus]